MEDFNATQDAVRVIAILLPSCPDCLHGFDEIKKVFLRFDSKKLQGFIVWISKSKDDTEEKAQTNSDQFTDPRIAQFWDGDRVSGRMFANVLRLQNGVAWETYLIYSPRIKWESEELVPEPASWLHQVSSDLPIDQKLLFDANRFREELKFMLEVEDPGLADRELTQVLLDKEKKNKYKE